MMSAMQLQSLAPIVAGHCHGDARFQAVTTDSRQVAEGDLFVALSGEHFDGHRFVADAFDQGAVAALVSQPLAERDKPFLQVEDTRKALGLIARQNRRQFQGPVVAITGSAGKTSTKQILAALLQQGGEVLATAGNFNNEIGVPLTLLAISSKHQYAVVEMGARFVGDIDYLCQLAEPDISLVNNVLPAHLECFGSVQAIAAAKAEIYQGLSATGIAVINLDQDFAETCMTVAADRQCMTFSLSDTTADVYASDIRSGTNGMLFKLHYAGRVLPIELPLRGHHAVANALAAATCALAAGLDVNLLAAGFASVESAPGRLQIQQLDQLTLIDDSYNANPGSVKAAIDVLATMPAPRTLILGTMAELGESSEALHCEVATYAAQQGIQRLITVGPFAQQQLQAFAGDGVAYADLAALLRDASSVPASGTVLVKGSRSAGMERVVEWFKTNNQQAGAE